MTCVYNYCTEEKRGTYLKDVVMDYKDYNNISATQAMEAICKCSCALCLCCFVSVVYLATPVSYTHLDVYKRQVLDN